MKWYQFILSIFLPLWGVAIATAQEVEVLTFVDNFATTQQGATSLLVPNKTARKSAEHGGHITLDIPECPDSILQAIQIAVDLWEERLPIGANIWLSIDFQTIEDDVRVQVRSLEYNGSYYPLSLYHSLISSNYNDAPDAIIHLSATANWTCSYDSQTSNNQKNLTSAMLRAIAISMGFGSSVTEKVRNGTTIFNFPWRSNSYYLFDQLIYNNNDFPLTNIPQTGPNRDNPTLRQYYTLYHDNLEVQTDTSYYALYAPQTFIANKSMIYLNLPTSLMHYDIPIGVKRLAIDDATLDILNQLGWNLSSPSVEIYCNDLDETGISSIYQSYTFGINKHGHNITNLHWKYSIRTNNNSFNILKEQSTGNFFTIDSITDISTLYFNSDGDAEGIIELAYTIGGNEEKAFYKLTLESTPRIIAFYNQCIHDEFYPTYYNYSFTVKYIGASSLTIGVEQEYSAWYDIIHINEPYLAHAYISNLSKGNYVWIDVTATNDYGSDMQTIEIPTLGTKKRNDDYTTNMEATGTENVQNIAFIDVFSIEGLFLKRITDIKYLEDYHKRSLILRYVDANGSIIKTKKINRK